jgi:hypothetical protein
MGLSVFFNQVDLFLKSQSVEAKPHLQKAISRAQQIISQTNVEELSPKQSLQCMRKVSGCFKNHPDVREHVQEIMHAELEKMKQVEANVFPQKRPATQIKEPSPKRRKKEEISRKRLRESGDEKVGAKRVRLDGGALTTEVERKEAQAREYISKGMFEEAIELRTKIAQITFPPDHPLVDMEQAIVQASEGKPLSRMGAYFQGLDTGSLKMGTIHASKRRIVVNTRDPNEVPKETFCFDFYLTHVARQELEKTISLIQAHSEDFEKISGHPIHILPETKTVLPAYIEQKDAYAFGAGSGARRVGKGIEIEIGSLGKICIQTDPVPHSLYNRVEIILNAQKNLGLDGLKDLHTILSLFGLGTTLCTSRPEDETRMKIFILLHAFFPVLSYQMERDPDNYNISIEELRKKICALEKDAGQILNKYLDANPEAFVKEELYSGRDTYMVRDMGKSVREHACGLLFGTKSVDCSWLKWVLDPVKAHEKFRKIAADYAQQLKAGVTQYSNREAWLSQGDIGAGSCPGLDMDVGGFDSVFTRLIPKSYAGKKSLEPVSFCSDGLRVLVDSDVMGYASCYAHPNARCGARVDTYWYLSKEFEVIPYSKRPGLLEFASQTEEAASKEMKGERVTFPTESNEVMIRDMIPTKFMRAILVKQQEMKDILVEEFKKAGLIQEREGRECVVLPGCVKPVDEFIYVGQVCQEEMWAKPAIN